MGKKILFIAPASIPIFGAEAIVNVKLLYALLDAGYEIDLVSKKNKWADYPESDLSISDRLNSINTISVDNNITPCAIFQHIMSFFTFGTVYRGSHWAYKALQYIKRHIDVSKYDAVITKNGPSELIGYWLKKNKGLKWIATWNDPFPKNSYPVPYGIGPVRQPWYMRKLIAIMRSADYSVIPSDRLYRYMDGYVHFYEERIRIIPHVALADVPCQKRQDGEIKILVSGNNKSPRDPRPLIKAFSKVIASAKIKAKLVFVGGLDDDVDILIRDLHVENYIKILPAVSYEDSMNMLRSYDLAILIEASCSEGIFLPTKIVDFMQVQIPVLAISPKIGVLNDLYNDKCIGYFANCSDQQSIEKELNKIFNDYEGGLCVSRLPNNFRPESVVKVYEQMIC